MNDTIFYKGYCNIYMIFLFFIFSVSLLTFQDFQALLSLTIIVDTQWNYNFELIIPLLNLSTVEYIGESNNIPIHEYIF